MASGGRCPRRGGVREETMQEQPNEIHVVSDPATRWSRVNAIEAFPTLAKPLSWDFFGSGTNATWRAMFENFGLIGPGEPMPAGGDAGYEGIFFGRPAVNMTMMIAGMGLFPGDQSRNHARELFSEDAADGDGRQVGRPFDRETFGRYVDEVAGIVRRQHEDLIAYWRSRVGPAGLRDGFDPAATMREAYDRFVVVLTDHSANSTLCQQYFSRATDLAREAGLADQATDLTTGIGDTFDIRSMSALWQISRGNGTMEDYLASFGFQTSSGDDISAPSWRENPSALCSLVDAYARMPDKDSPTSREHERAAKRAETERQIIVNLPEVRRDEARQVLGRLVDSTRARELGKATYKIALDLGRAAARARGGQLHATRRIDEPDDVFFLTMDEAFGAGEAAADLRARIALRKATRDRYAGYEIPTAWTGNPEVIAAGEAPLVAGGVKGIGVSAGVAEGPVRLVLDHSAAEVLEPGEILVTNTTDPSWGPFFVVAGALVIDIGGPMSHGAIIARELGIPCVINTGHGSRALKDGMMIRVDGDTGEVTVLESSG